MPSTLSSALSRSTSDSSSSCVVSAGTPDAMYYGSGNRWYTLKVEVRGEHISTYIDGERVHDFNVEVPDILYANAEVDEKSGELIVKVVNFGETDAPVNISLTSGSRYDLSKGRLTLLKGDALDENTKDEPEKVVPQTVPFAIGADGRYLAPANSLSIIRVK